MDVALAVVAGTSGVLAAGALSYVKLRQLLPVSVNCWFCNANAKVSFKKKNSFLCPSCKQYNGFTEDGDYNCDMPSQYCESLNSPPSKLHQFLHKHSSASNNSPSISSSNGFCQTCNLYQAMKVKALAEFEPSHPDKFDEEIEIYERRLQRLYGGLCRACNQTLKCRLGEQDSWLKPKLIHWRLQQSSLLKGLLTPLHNGLSRRSHFFSVMLRLLCILATVVLLFVSFSDALGDSLQQFSFKGAVVRGSNTTVNADTDNEQINGQSEFILPLLQLARSVQSTLSPLLSWCYTAQRHHEAGVVMALLALLLTAVAVAGKQLLQAWDAAGCLLLLALLGLSCWQDSDTALALVSTQQLACFKVVLHSGVCAVVLAGLGISSRPPTQRRRPRDSAALDWSQDSILSNSSFNSSQGSYSPAPRGLSPQVSTAPPSVLSCATASSVLAPSSTYLPLQGGAASFELDTSVPQSLENGYLSCGMMSRLLASGPQNGGNFNSARFGVANLGPHSGLNPTVVASGSSFVPGYSLKRSYLGENNLDASLGSLQIGTGRKQLASNTINASNAFLQHDYNYLNSPSYRSFTPASQARQKNINGIAQSSWVAGGYWGSPTKSNRSNAYTVSNGGPVFKARHLDRGVRDEINEVFPLSRSSSQSSGFVSHGSDTHTANNINGGRGGRPNFSAAGASSDDRSSVASEPAFVWNYESCETSSQTSQNTNSIAGDADVTVRRRDLGGVGSDARSVFSGVTTTTGSQFSSAVSSPWNTSRQKTLIPQQLQEEEDFMMRRSPYEDMQAMRALSRLSQHDDISDDDLSLLSRSRTLLGDCGGSVVVAAAAKPNTINTVTYRNPWVAFILGMSVMANGFLALVLYKNGTLFENLK